MKFNLPGVQNGIDPRVNILNFVDEWNRRNTIEMRVQENGTIRRGSVFWELGKKHDSAYRSLCFNTFTELAEYLDGFILGIELAQKE